MFTVVLDACVLVPATLNDTLLTITEAGGFGVRWSRTILDEVTRTITRLGVPDDSARRRTDAMDAAFAFAAVRGFDPLIPLMTNDEKDRHVLAAAVKAEVSTIVTANIKDFPHSSLEPWGIQVVDPDAFLLDQLDLAPGLVVSAVSEQAAASRRPPLTVHDLCGSLARCGVPEFADELRRHL
jgi:predicted nucleic acid-binding protein